MIPNVFIEDKEKCVNQLRVVLTILNDAHHIHETDCDEIIDLFKQFREEVHHSEASSKFSAFSF